MIDNLFSSSLFFNCDLRNQTLLSLFNHWEKDKNLKNSISGEYYLKRVINDNDFVVSSFRWKSYESQDVHMIYNRKEKILNLEIKPSKRGYLLFLIVPLSVIVLLNNESVEQKFWLIPVISIVVIFLFFKWVVYIEKENIRIEIEKVLHQLAPPVEKSK